MTISSREKIAWQVRRRKSTTILVVLVGAMTSTKSFSDAFQVPAKTTAIFWKNLGTHRNVIITSSPTRRQSSCIHSVSASSGVGGGGGVNGEFSNNGLSPQQQREEAWNPPSTRYDADPSDHRYSASDWWHNMKSLPRSSILREIKGPVLTLMAWSTFISALHQTLLLSTKTAPWANYLCLSSTPHSLLVSALGLLLVFRTNSAYQRFAEGRLIWENILSISRNMSRMAMLYHRELGEARLQRVLRLLSAFPYLLRHHISPQCLDYNQRLEQQSHQHHDPSTATNGLMLLEEPINKKQRMLSTKAIIKTLNRRNRNNKGIWTRFRWNAVQGQQATADRDSHHDALSSIQTNHCDCWVDTRSVPWCLLPEGTLNNCISSSNRPLWVCDRLSQELTNVAYTPNFTSRERLTFLSQVDKLSICIGECERIHQTAVPLNYARHSIRSLTIWLFTLPFALVGDLGMLTGPVMGVISWLLLGVYQIGYTIEDPFQRALRLSILCDAIYRDVMSGTEHMERRQTAFEVGYIGDGLSNSNNNNNINRVILSSSFDSDEDDDDDEQESDPLALMKPISMTSDQDPSKLPRP